MAQQPPGAGKSSFDLIDQELLFRKLALSPDDVLLDLGCGRGNYSFAAAGHIHKAGAIHAVDLWAEGVAAVETRAREKGCRQIQAHHVDASDALPLADHSVDLCLIATVLHDLVVADKHRGALAEIVRVLKPGGQLAIVEFEKIDGPPGPPRHIRLAPADLEALLAPHGFSAEALTPLGPELYLAQFQWRRERTGRSAP
ncbi:MAG: methyltransferase domain-containing protein [Desulfosarcinaceae bacterium]|jgi:ubiquinone/menaquinone biosynthesis C-methylase UbiE